MSNADGPAPTLIEPLPPQEDCRSEARRIFAICNICGYCNGFCAVFDAARERPALTDADLDYLANLCHSCRNCLEACQYQPPHLFSLNVPRTLEQLRWQGYAERVRPRVLAMMMHAPRRVVLFSLLGALILALLLGLWLHPAAQLDHPALARADFYRIVPLNIMVAIGVLTLGGALVSILFSLTEFWKAISAERPPASIRMDVLRKTLWDITSLRHLNGGGPGCIDSHTNLAPARRWLHQLLLAGVLSCLIATVLAAFWHHGLGIQAPYALASPPVMMGLFGGLLVVPAAIGLLWIKRRTNALALAPQGAAADDALTLLLLAVVLSGLALLAWRTNPAMGPLLLLHLGWVYGFFLLLPTSKAVHAGYRTLALLRRALDSSTAEPKSRE